MATSLIQTRFDVGMESAELRQVLLTDDKTLDWSNLKQIADDILKFILNAK